MPMRSTVTVTMIPIFMLLLLFIPNSALALSNFTKLLLPLKVTGPESIAFDPSGGGPYTGVSDGRILKYECATSGFTDYAYAAPNRSKAACDGTLDPNSGPTCGRPFGIGFYNKTGDLYIADAYAGLLVVNTSGGHATTLATAAEGVPFRFPDGLDVDQPTGKVYFTDASSVYEMRQLIQAVATNDSTGRLLVYDPSTNQVKVLMRGLSGPGGVAVSGDGSFVLVSEFIGERIRKFWLTGPKANTSEILLTFQGRPDNIKATSNGTFWVAVATGNSLLVSLPTGRLIDADGKVLRTENFAAQYGFSMISEVQERGDGCLFVGSRTASFVGVYDEP